MNNTLGVQDTSVRQQKAVCCIHHSCTEVGRGNKGLDRGQGSPAPGSLQPLGSLLFGAENREHSLEGNSGNSLTVQLGTYLDAAADCADFCLNQYSQLIRKIDINYFPIHKDSQSKTEVNYLKVPFIVKCTLTCSLSHIWVQNVIRFLTGLTVHCLYQKFISRVPIS